MANQWRSHLIRLILGSSGLASLLTGVWFTYRTQYENPAYRYLPADQEWRDHLKTVLEVSRQKVSEASVAAVLVDVSGAVTKPGLYQLNPGARVQEAILAAGGFVTEVDRQYVHQRLNLADLARDRSKIYVPFDGEEQLAALVLDQPGEQSLPVNTASVEKIKSLPGIGDKRAADWVANRPYRDEADFRQRSGLTAAIITSLIESGEQLIY